MQGSTALQADNPAPEAIVYFDFQNQVRFIAQGHT